MARGVILTVLGLLAGCYGEGGLRGADVRATPAPHAVFDAASLRTRLTRQYATTTPSAKGAVVIAVAADSTELVAAFGTMSKDDRRPPNEDTVFEVGSVTKVMTGVALADAVMRGRVALDDDAQRFLPDVSLPTHEGQPIRLVHLATYSSGLPWMPTNWIRVDEGTYTPAMWRDFLRTYVLPHAPGEGFEYGNVGFGLLGDALAAREETTLGELFRRRLFLPLGMRHSWLLGERPATAEVPQGYDEEGKLVPLLFDKPLQAGCCAVESSAHDLLAFLRAHWDGKTPQLTSAFDLALAPRLKGGDSHADQEVGLGWFLRDGFAIKGGVMRGYRTGVALDRSRHLAAVVLAADAAFPSETLAIEALEALAAEMDPPSLPTLDVLPSSATATDISWESGLHLVGWSSPSRAKRGDTVTVTYFYRADVALPADYKVFVHGDVKGQRIRADHTPPRPTSDWPPGRIVADRFSLSIPADHPGGTVVLWSGFYRRERMKVASIDAADGHDRVHGPDILVE